MLDNSISTSTLSSTLSLSQFMHYAQYFVPGMIWLGPYVFFLSMLITSSRLYCIYYDNSAMYAINNILNISLSVVAIFLGNVYNIPQLSGFSGTFFTLYFTQKYIEVMPNRKEVWAASSILIGILLYLVNVYFRAEIETHGLQEYFHLFPPIPTTLVIN
jgi:predicted transglutaminase-like protease